MDSSIPTNCPPHFPGMSSFSVTGNGNAGDFRQSPTNNLQLPLSNLSVLRRKMDSLQIFLSQSIDRNTLLGKDQMDMVSAEITSAIQQIIVNGTDLIASENHLGGDSDSVVFNRNQTTSINFDRFDSDHRFDSNQVVEKERIIAFGDLKQPLMNSSQNSADLEGFMANQTDFNSLMSSWGYEKKLATEKSKDFEDSNDLKEEEMRMDLSEGGCEVVEIDAVELLAEHVHFCEICGKGFKRDANLRMHMRAHGNQFKTPEALSKPHDCAESPRKTRFSCPFAGCNRNKSHKKFQPLKSVICVKNHFKRSHCPKMYSCNRCQKKSFSVVSDLKSHFKHCGESKWRCSCGTTFSRKDKLFGHLALFEGHMPEEDEKSKEAVDMDEDEEKVMVDSNLEGNSSANVLDFGIFDGFDGFDGLGGFDNDCLKDMFGSPMLDTRMGEPYHLP